MKMKWEGRKMGMVFSDVPSANQVLILTSNISSLYLLQAARYDVTFKKSIRSIGATDLCLEKSADAW
jgi:hypothetical protein